ncbi:MAG: DUF3343 domain-containing protein [Thermodesulfobacteriota bacterium]
MPHVIILSSIHYVLKAEQLLKAKGIPHDVVPVPRAISADCGMAIEFGEAELDRVQAVLQAADIAIARLYRQEGAGEFTELNWKEQP